MQRMGANAVDAASYLLSKWFVDAEITYAENEGLKSDLATS